MWKISIKGLIAHKLRFLASAIAVVLGVAFFSGTGVLTDTISGSFNDLYGDVYKDTDAVVRSTSTVTVENEKQRARIDSGLLATVAKVNGAQDAEGVVQDYARIVGHDGKALGDPDQGAPTYGGNWINTDALSPWVLSSGKAPSAPNEVVIDKGSAKKGKLNVGDHTKVLTKSGSYDVTVVGIAKFGTTDSPGGASFALFDTADAQRIVGEPGKFDAIALTARPDTSQDALRTAVSKVVPQGDEAITGATAIKESQDDVKAGLKFFNTFMFAFAIISLIVGSFIIYNTFSIVVAQRGREMALLRAIGARRRQVLGSVVVEAVVVGVVASAIGIVAGIGVALALTALLNAFGFGVPSGHLVIGSDKVVTGMLMGVAITVIAAFAPARRASKVAPIAALRDVAVDKSAKARVRFIAGLVLGVAAVVAVVAGIAGTEPAFAGLGGFLLLVTTLVLGPAFAGRASNVLGSRVTGVAAVLAGAALIALGVTGGVVAALIGVAVGSLLIHSGRSSFGMTGVLARSNASRNPKRTSSTASALTIGVAIVVFFTVFASSVQGSLSKLVDDSFSGDLSVRSGAQMEGGLPSSVLANIKQTPGVRNAVGNTMGNALIDGSPVMISMFDAQQAFTMFDFGVSAGNAADLDANSIAVYKQTAKDHGWKIGSSVPARFLDTGDQNLRIAAIYDKSSIPGEYVLDRSAFQKNFHSATDSFIYVDVKDGAKVADVRSAIDKQLAAYPTADVLDNSEMKKALGAKFDVMLGFIYVMLALSILIALIGIANTLALSVFERTREIGLLRAIGMAAAQVRSALRWESAIIALFGTVIGLAFGVGFAWVLIRAMNQEGFEQLVVPSAKLGVIVVMAAVAGILAAVLPARKASKLNVLAAIRAD